MAVVGTFLKNFFGTQIVFPTLSQVPERAAKSFLEMKFSQGNSREIAIICIMAQKKRNEYGFE